MSSLQPTFSKILPSNFYTAKAREPRYLLFLVLDTTQNSTYTVNSSNFTNFFFILFYRLIHILYNYGIFQSFSALGAGKFIKIGKCLLFCIGFVRAENGSILSREVRDGALSLCLSKGGL